MVFLLDRPLYMHVQEEYIVVLLQPEKKSRGLLFSSSPLPQTLSLGPGPYIPLALVVDLLFLSTRLIAPLSQPIL